MPINHYSAIGDEWVNLSGSVPGGGPTTPGAMQVGVDWDNTASRLQLFGEFEDLFTAQTGIPQIPYLRIYCQSATPTPTTSTGEWGDVRGRLNAGYKVCVSWKDNAHNWASIASGSEDARTDAIAAYLEASDSTGGNYACFYHEPEDNSPAQGTPANFRAAQKRIYDRFKALAPSWDFGPILHGSAMSTEPNYNGNLQPPISNWLQLDAIDYVGVDTYNYRGPAQGTPAANPSDPMNTGWATNANRDPDEFQDWVDYLDGFGINRIIIPEYTTYIKNPTTFPAEPAGRAAFIQSWADRWGPEPAVELWIWYEADQMRSFGAGRISGGVVDAEPASMSAFASVMS